MRFLEKNKKVFGTEISHTIYEQKEMEENKMGNVTEVVNGAVDVTEKYVEYASATTGLSVTVICLIGISLAMVIYKLTKSLLSIVFGIGVALLLLLVARQFGLF